MKRFITLWLTMLLVLVGCESVEVQIGDLEEPPQITSGQAFALASFTEGGVVRQVARPLVVFTGNETFVDTFPLDVPEREYLVVGDGGRYVARINNSALWTADTEGEASFEAELFVRREGEQEFESHSYGLIEPYYAIGVHRIDEQVDLIFEPEAPGIYDLRIVVSAESPFTESTVQQSEVATQVVAFTRPTTEYFEDPDAGMPRFGELEQEDEILLDWRPFGNGPCRLESDNAELVRLLDEACLTNETFDVDRLEDIYLEALELSAATPEVEANLRDQVGLLLAATGQWQPAARQFQESLRIWQSLDDVYRVGAALHNLGTSEYALGNLPRAETLLLQSIELREKADDFAGIFLTLGQLGLYWQEYEVVNEAAIVLLDLQWMQGDVLQNVALELQEQRQEEE